MEPASCAKDSSCYGQTQSKVTTTQIQQAVQSGGRFLSESLPLNFEGKELPNFKPGGEKHVERTK